MIQANAPLAGIRIADFTIHAAGPFATHLLSQMGAECIKIESRTRPDAFRKPHAVYGRMEAATFDQVSANKLSVRLNLKKPEAVVLAKQLVGQSDVAAESFRPGVLRRLGLAYDDLRVARPDLVMLSLSSSGQFGPDSHFAGYAPLFGAWGGLGWMSGYADGPPMEMRHVMDHSAGIHGALAIVAALHQRRRNGVGQYIDLAAREVASAMIGDALVLASVGQSAERLGNGSQTMAPHGLYLCNQADRWLSLAIRTDQEWHQFCQLLHKADVDTRFNTLEGRLAEVERLDRLVSEWMLSQDADALAAKLQSAGLCAHVSWNMQDVADDAHLHQRGFLTEVEAPGIPKRLAAASPARFSRSSEVGLRRLTPELGQDEDYVFGELLGLSSCQRQALEASEVIF